MNKNIKIVNGVDSMWIESKYLIPKDFTVSEVEIVKEKEYKDIIDFMGKNQLYNHTRGETRKSFVTEGVEILSITPVKEKEKVVVEKTTSKNGNAVLKCTFGTDEIYGDTCIQFLQENQEDHIISSEEIEKAIRIQKECDIAFFEKRVKFNSPFSLPVYTGESSINCDEEEEVFIGSDVEPIKLSETDETTQSQSYGRDYIKEYTYLVKQEGVFKIVVQTVDGWDYNSNSGTRSSFVVLELKENLGTIKYNVVPKIGDQE